MSQNIEKNSKKSHATQSKIGENAFIQNEGFEKPKNLVRATIEDINIEKEQKVEKKRECLETIKIPDSKAIYEMNKLGLNKTSSKKGDSVMDRLKNSLDCVKKLKKTLKLKFSNKSFGLIMTYLKKQHHIFYPFLQIFL